MRISQGTDIGCVRKENQDHYASQIICDNIAWAIVCDGMGGAKGGETASRIVTDLAHEHLKDMQQYSTDEEITGFISQFINKANTDIFDMSLNNTNLKGMGTTAVVTTFYDNILYVSNVGDSRGYVYRSGKLTQVTKDHSFVQELIDKGAISIEEAYNHPKKNLITRAIGVADKVKADYFKVEILKGDIILLCSDGLTNYLTDEEIASYIKNTKFEDVVSVLIEKVKTLGASDNITAVLVNTEEENG